MALVPARRVGAAGSLLYNLRTAYNLGRAAYRLYNYNSNPYGSAAEMPKRSSRGYGSRSSAKRRRIMRSKIPVKGMRRGGPPRMPIRRPFTTQYVKLKVKGTWFWTVPNLTEDRTSTNLSFQYDEHKFVFQLDEYLSGQERDYITHYRQYRVKGFAIDFSSLGSYDRSTNGRWEMVGFPNDDVEDAPNISDVQEAIHAMNVPLAQAQGAHWSRRRRFYVKYPACENEVKSGMSGHNNNLVRGLWLTTDTQGLHTKYYALTVRMLRQFYKRTDDVIPPFVPSPGTKVLLPCTFYVEVKDPRTLFNAATGASLRMKRATPPASPTTAGSATSSPPASDGTVPPLCTSRTEVTDLITGSCSDDDTINDGEPSGVVTFS